MTFGGSLLGDVIEWFLTRVGDRRQYKRRAGAFHMWWLPENQAPVQGIGMELSPNGIVFIIKAGIQAPEFNIRMRIREQMLPARVKRVRYDVMDYKGEKFNRYVCELQGIAADHWDAIVRYVNDTPEPIDRRKQQNQEMSNRVDDAYRLLPMAIQQKLIDLLVGQRKLEAPAPGQTPLIKLFYGGLVNVPGKGKAHRVNVHSRIKVNDDMMAYDSRFLVTEPGGEIIQQS